MKEIRFAQTSRRLLYLFVAVASLIGLVDVAAGVSLRSMNRKLIAAETRLAIPLRFLRASAQDPQGASSDLLVSKTGPVSAAAGSNVTFDVVVGNAGPDDAITVSLTDALPAGMTFVSESQNNGPVFNCSNPPVGSNGTITCTIATLTAGSSADFSFVMKIPLATPPATSFTNTATVATQSFDPNDENNAASTSVTTPDSSQADVGITKDGPSGASPNSDVPFTIVVTNSGPNAAQNVSFNDLLPNDMTFVSLTQGVGPAFNCVTPTVGSGGTVTCTAATFPNGANASFTLTGHIPAGAASGNSYQNNATVTSDDDPNDENNAATATVVVSSTDLAIVKTGPTTATAGGPIIWTITVSSAGPSAASNASLSDTLPSGTTFVSLTQNNGPAAICTTPSIGGSGTVSCTFATLNPGDSAQFSLAAAIAANSPIGTVISNTASITSGNSDPNPSNNNSAAVMTTVVGPTAASSSVSGRIADDRDAPLEGAVINLSGAQTRKTITDAGGQYRFDNVGVNGFYTVTPSRANFNFIPFNRSFNQLGNNTDAAFTGSSIGDSSNPLDTPEYFVRQQYVDVLGREPDEGGFNYWSDQINQCNGDAACVRSRRVDVAAAFFIEAEFQQTGSFIYDLYSGALGRRPVFAEYSTDRQQVLGGPNLDAEKAAFAQSFVQRAEFVAKYQSHSTPDSFVDALIQNVQQVSGVDLSSQRDALIRHYNTGKDMNQSRSFVLSDVAANATFNQAQYNPAFVLTEYFGYLQRNPDQSGYDYWLNVINGREVGNYRGMVCAFITSTEYQRRFSSVVSRGNGECVR